MKCTITSDHSFVILCRVISLINSCTYSFTNSLFSLISFCLATKLASPFILTKALLLLFNTANSERKRTTDFLRLNSSSLYFPRSSSIINLAISSSSTALNVLRTKAVSFSAPDLIFDSCIMTKSLFSAISLSISSILFEVSCSKS